MTLKFRPLVLATYSALSAAPISASGVSSTRGRQAVAKHFHHRCLDNLVFQRSDTQRSLSAVCLWNIHRNRAMNGGLKDQVQHLM